MQIGKCKIPNTISYIPTADTASDRFQAGCCVILIIGTFVPFSKNTRFESINYYTMKFKNI